MSQVSDLLKKLVPKKGKTKKEVADKLKISPQLLGQYMKDRQKPKTGFYVKWKEVFGEDLLNIEETNVSRETETKQEILAVGALQVTLKDHYELMKEKDSLYKEYTSVMKRIIEAKLLDPRDSTEEAGGAPISDEKLDEQAAEDMLGTSEIVDKAGGTYQPKKKKKRK